MIECHNLGKTYRKGDIETVALHDVTFTINKGDFVAIMGPSGSGKSTLMHLLGALDQPTHGTYHLDGHDVAKMDEDSLAELRRDKIGFVFQAFNLLPRATALRNVMLPLVYANVEPDVRRARAEKALASAGLEASRFGHHSNQLSGGQMQRVAIARALINDPVLILADEPTGNLDTRTGEVVLDTFQRLNRDEGRTIVLITHERYVAEHADRILHIRDGTIKQDEHTPHRRVAHVTNPAL